MQQIYIIQSIDELENNPGSKTRILKAFHNKDDAMEYIAECGYQVEQYNKQLPEETGDDEKDTQSWDNWCHNHPFYYEDGSIGTTFELIEIELE